MTDLYCIGEMVIDFIPGAEPDSYIRKAGGAPANVAISAVKNGLTAAMCCKVGEDSFGKFLLETLAEYGVRAACPETTSEAVTTMAFVTLAKDGERLFTFARKPGADMFLTEADVKEDDIRDAAIIHAGSCSLSAGTAAEATTKALRLGRELGKLVSFDVNYRDVMWRGNVKACTEAVLRILPYVDLLKISEEEVDMLGGAEALPGLMETCDIALILETLGSKGARAYFAGNEIYVPGRAAKAVDATGAGDAFWGAFLSSLRHQGVDVRSDLTADILRTAMEYGNVSGSLCVRKKGAIAALPMRTEIEAFLQKKDTEE